MPALIVALVSILLLVIAGVATGATTGLDEVILRSLRVPGNLSDPLGPRWLEEAVRDITALGSTSVLSLLVLAVTTWLLLTKGWRSALIVCASTTSGLLLSNAVKWTVARPRPTTVSHEVEVYTSSFPSTHALMSAVVYLTLGSLLAQRQTDAHVRYAVIAGACAITALVGISRLYLGLHWPTDVLAGWCIGGLWAIWCRALDDTSMLPS